MERERDPVYVEEYLRKYMEASKIASIPQATFNLAPIYTTLLIHGSVLSTRGT